ncbi:hypothetical protein FACS1894174_00820 [Bacteroidia bacterium]|nr:hypothetical protein FACS1894203_5000 [Bacteroidia bacterium]GHV19935.1 hypothetical protein FACS1894174_00820 [Bacteroidia bacterium]
MEKVIFNLRHNFYAKITLLLLFLGVLACSELPVGQTPTDNTSPASLKNVVITPTNGGAYITYTLPNEDDISYVKCEFTYNGKLRVVRSSVYKNYMEVDGIGDPEEIELKLYVVDHSENISQPFIQKFLPLDPPMKAVFNSFSVEPTFGGVFINWENPSKTMMGISILAADDNGEMQLKDMIFSSLPTGSKRLRGFDTRKRLFALSITDKYENISDTFKIEVEPYYEIMLDKSKFSSPALSGDNTSVNDNRPIEKIWDGVLDDPDKYHGWHTDAAAGYTIPQHFSIDLGVKAQLTHVIIFERGEIYPFAQHNLRLFDVWGTDHLEYPRDNAAYFGSNEWKKDWVLLAKCEVVKPSGMPPGTNTPEDLAAHNAGFDFDFRQDVPKMRYIRFEVHDTWAHTPAMHMAELSVYGDDR